MTRPVNVAILGATGSIGQQTLDVIDRNPARLRLFGLTEGRRSAKRMAEYVIQGQAGEPDFDSRVREMVTDPRCDIVAVAIPGARALAPTLAALEAGEEVAPPTKEGLVILGDPDEQGSRDDRGAPPLRSAPRAGVGHHPPPERGALPGGVRRWLAEGTDRSPRHAPAHSCRPRLP